MHNRNYCCYRHFKQGKDKHDPSCTHCFSHVPLGVINPTPASPHKQPKQTTPMLQIRSKPFRIQKRTHDYNQLQNKQSLPKRLRQPRVYVQKINTKFEKTQPLLPIKLTGNSQYQLSVAYFRKIGQSLTHKTKQELMNIIKNYAIQHQIRVNQKIFLNKNQFAQFILSNFHKFHSEQVENFWNITYNQMRFKDKISAQAFVFNFGKFYLSLQNYNNTFSQTALRQRVIDLRVLLFDWYHNEVYLKYNLKTISESRSEIEKTLKYSDQQQLFGDFNINYLSCKKVYTNLRLLAQTFFNLTDNKFITASKIKTAMQNKIEEKAQKIETSRKILQNFFQIQDYSQQQNFPVTDLIQFCKQENYNQKTITQMIGWIQGLFDYIYFQKDEKQNSEIGLSLNTQTKRLQCHNVLQINAKLVREYDNYLQNLYSQQIQILKNLSALAKQTIQKIPKLQGPKKQIVQCNYITETLLRFVRAVDLSEFWYLFQSISTFKTSNSPQKIKQVFRQRPNQQQIKRLTKFLFSPASAQNKQTQHLATEQSSVQSEKDKVFLSINRFNNIKQQKLMLKAKPQKKAHTNSQGNQQNNLLNGSFQNNAQKQEHEQQNLKQYNDLTNDLPGKGDEPKLNIHRKENPKCSEECGNSHLICRCRTKYILQITKQDNDTISTIESLESRIFSLLNYEC